ncbi:hypothetical protein BDV96DRAFT_617277 [Lophiotrema nucula]|uniref:Uncharacterized protein n=1 Tax=Lophiotrema nucula TaxID=690887 RepID=A0A6A5YHK9_9PLEO|nr:hypothetical protein BDV96DRAFT_617277 [Lophiotrema nucula]
MSRHPRPDRRLSFSSLPEIAILPTPLPADSLPVGQLVTKSSKLNPTTLEDRDYDDIGTRWFKDVILVDSSTGKFTESLGGTRLVQKKPDGKNEVGTIEAEEMRIRLLKDASASLKRALESPPAAKWVQEQVSQGEEIGFVTGVREVSNASYKRARLVDVGAGNYEVIREVGGETKEGKRRDSGLDVQTGSKKDIVGVIVQKLGVDGDSLSLTGQELGAQFWE